MDYSLAKKLFLEVADKHEVEWMHAKDHGFTCPHEGQAVETLYDDIRQLGPQLGTPDWYITYQKDEGLEDFPDLPENCVAVLNDRAIDYIGFIEKPTPEAELKNLLIRDLFQPVTDDI